MRLKLIAGIAAVLAVAGMVGQAEAQSKAKRPQIAEGKLAKRLKEVVLLDQPFLKDEKVSVKQRVEAVAKAAGLEARIRRFARVGAGA